MSLSLWGCGVGSSKQTDGPGPAPSPAARPAASSSPTRPGGTFLAGDLSQLWLLITPLVGGSL